MASATAGGQGPLTVARLPRSFEALALLLELLSEDAFFGQEPLSRMMKVVKAQVGHGTHVAAFRGKRLVGYAGYIFVRPDNGRAWMAGKATLQPLEPKVALALPAEQRAGALTVVAAREAEAILPLMRKLRDSHRGYRVFFKREYLPGGREERKRTVRAV